MSQTKIKLLSALAIIFLIVVTPIVVLATNEDVSVVETQNDEYMIYIKNYTDEKANFKYAFTSEDLENPQEMDLVYINSISDLGGNNAALLDFNAKTYEKLKDSETIYMWAKDENGNLILEGIQLDLGNSITKENLDLVEKTTKRIDVEIADNEDKTTEVRNETIDGVEETAAVGTVTITDKDAKKAKYYYQRVKAADSTEHNNLMELAEKINKEYEAMDMYNKVQIGEEFYNSYTKLVGEADWKKVEDLKIEQPEGSVAGDKYIVFLKKVAKDGETIDAQFLTAYDDYKPNVVKEQIVTQETTKLPITYDSIALIVILAVVVIALVIVFIRMKKLDKKDEEK